MPSITNHELIDDGEGQSDIEPSYRFVCSTSPKKSLSIYKLDSPRTRCARTVLAKGTVIKVAGLTAKRNDCQEAYAVRRQHLFVLAKLSSHGH
jgi:hypothetical protein